jgi:hypothetical protein
MSFGSVHGNGGPAYLPGHFFVCSLLWVDLVVFVSEAWGAFLKCCFPPLTGGITFFCFAKRK